MKTRIQFIYSSLVLYLLITAGQILAVQNGKKETISIKWQTHFGKPGVAVGEFKNPAAISVDPTGALYVCDTGNHRIQKFNSQGEFLCQLGGFGWERKQFYQPRDIHALSTLDIFIADYQNQRIERYDRELNYISSLRSNSTWDEKLQFSWPIALAFSQQRELFILDEENQKVVKINSSGKPEMQFGGYNWGIGQLKQPHQIVISNADRIFVSDSEANKIVIFDYFGNYLDSWGENFLNNPTGIFWDQSGLLFIADTGNHRFVVLDQDGELRYDSRVHSSNSPELIEPVDIAFFSTQISVLDAGKACVHLYQLIE